MRLEIKILSLHFLLKYGAITFYKFSRFVVYELGNNKQSLLC